MKKTIILSSLLLLLVAPALSSCGNEDSISNFKLANNPEGAFIDLAVIGGETLKLENLVSQKDNFVLYVYDYNCTACSEFSPLLQNYVKESEELVYAISSSTYGNRETSLNFPNVTYPSIIFGENGSPKIVESYSDNKKAFSSMSGIRKMMDQRIRDGHVYLMNAITTPYLTQDTFFTYFYDADSAFTTSWANSIGKSENSFTICFYNSQIQESKDFMYDYYFEFGSKVKQKPTDHSKRLYVLDLKRQLKSTDSGKQFFQDYHLPEVLKTHGGISRISNGSHESSIKTIDAETIEYVDGAFKITSSTYPELINKSSSKESKLKTLASDYAVKEIKNLLNRTIE